MRTPSVRGDSLRTYHLITRWVLVCILLAAVSAIAPRTAAAQSPTPGAQVDDHEKRIKELEETVHELKKDERQTEVNLENLKPLAGWSTDGFTLASQDGSYKLRIGGYTQLDGRFFIADANNDNTSQFLFRRVRPILEGTVAKYFDFRVMPDFGQGQTVLYDAYVDANFVKWGELRIGKFKPPVGLERLQSATALTFAERGLPTNLVPNRDLGGQFFGQVFDGALTYQLGIFNGVPDLGNGNGDVNDDKDFDGRVFALPFAPTGIPFLAGFGAGLAGTYGHEKGTTSNTDLPTYKSFGQANIFSFKTGSPATVANTVIAQGPRSRISPQAYYYYGPFGFLGEFVQSEERVSLNAKAESLTNTAWSLTFSWVLTGEANTYKNVIPAQPFNPFQGKWGAFEVAARYGQLLIDNDSFKDKYADITKSVKEADEWIIGANWFLNRNIEVMLDYGNTVFDGGSKYGNRRSESVIIWRTQLVF